MEIRSSQFKRFGRRATGRLLREAMLLVGTFWAWKRQEPLAKFCEIIDSELWLETSKEAEKIFGYGLEKLRSSKVIQGGPGAVPLLYFLTRHVKPSFVLETGVASGWSSAAFLVAMAKNSRGELFSSDLPYPERYGSDEAVGLVVAPELRGRWKPFFLGPDRETLPKIMDEIGAVTIFHYDSDKSLEGRKYATQMVWDHLTHDAILIFDDIQDNPHFARFVGKGQIRNHVFKFGGKYVGLALKTETSLSRLE